jgi:hypothetical protein
VLGTGVSSNGRSDLISTIFPAASIYAIESGILVFRFQKAAVFGWSKMKSMPWSSGIESRNIRPRSEVRGVSATSVFKTLDLMCNCRVARRKALGVCCSSQAAKQHAKHKPISSPKTSLARDFRADKPLFERLVGQVFGTSDFNFLLKGGSPGGCRFHQRKSFYHKFQSAFLSLDFSSRNPGYAPARA